MFKNFTVAWRGVQTLKHKHEIAGKVQEFDKCLIYRNASSASNADIIFHAKNGNGMFTDAETKHCSHFILDNTVKIGIQCRDRSNSRPTLNNVFSATATLTECRKCLRGPKKDESSPDDDNHYVDYLIVLAPLVVSSPCVALNYLTRLGQVGDWCGLSAAYIPKPQSMAPGGYPWRAKHDPTQRIRERYS